MTHHPVPAPQQPWAPAQPAAAPAPDAVQSGPGGVVVVNIQGSSWTQMLTPTLIVDGFLVRSAYGPNPLSLSAGVHRIEMYAEWIVKYGRATLDVQVPPGGTVQLYYRAPVIQLVQAGSIGYHKQRAKGVGLLVGFVALVTIASVLLAWLVT